MTNTVKRIYNNSDNTNNLAKVCHNLYKYSVKNSPKNINNVYDGENHEHCQFKIDKTTDLKYLLEMRYDDYLEKYYIDILEALNTPMTKNHYTVHEYYYEHRNNRGKKTMQRMEKLCWGNLPVDPALDDKLWYENVIKKIDNICDEIKKSEILYLNKIEMADDLNQDALIAVPITTTFRSQYQQDMDGEMFMFSCEDDGVYEEEEYDEDDSVFCSGFKLKKNRYLTAQDSCNIIWGVENKVLTRNDIKACNLKNEKVFNHNKLGLVPYSLLEDLHFLGQKGCVK